MNQLYVLDWGTNKQNYHTQNLKEKEKILCVFQFSHLLCDSTEFKTI